MIFSLQTEVRYYFIIQTLKMQCLILITIACYHDSMACYFIFLLNCLLLLDIVRKVVGSVLIRIIARIAVWRSGIGSMWNTTWSCVWWSHCIIAGRLNNGASAITSWRIAVAAWGDLFWRIWRRSCSWWHSKIILIKSPAAAQWRIEKFVIVKIFQESVCCWRRSGSKSRWIPRSN